MRRSSQLCTLRRQRGGGAAARRWQAEHLGKEPTSATGSARSGPAPGRVAVAWSAEQLRLTAAEEVTAPATRYEQRP